MPTPQQVSENRFMTLDRLVSLSDRIIWQHAQGECWPEAVWWEGRPQVGGPKLWLSTCKWLKSGGLIIEGLRPKDSVYRDMMHVTAFVATPAAEDAYLDCAVASFRSQATR